MAEARNLGYTILQDTDPTKYKVDDVNIWESLSCITSDWKFAGSYDKILFSTTDFTEDYYSFFGEREYVTYISNEDDSWMSFLVPKLDNQAAEEGDLGAIVCADVWNNENDTQSSYKFPSANKDVYLFLLQA